MKSLINWLAVIALLLIFGSNSNAQTVTLVGDVSGAIGSEHTIELHTSDLTGLGITALDITVQYDRSKVFIYSADDGSVISNSSASFEWSNLFAGKIFRITAATGGTFTGSGVIATLKVKVVGSSGLNSSGISFASATYSKPPSTISNFVSTDVASVNVTGGTPITVSIPAQTLLPNTNSVTVPVTISDIAKYGIFSWSLELDYNATYFDIVGASSPGGDYAVALTTNFSTGKAIIIGTLNNGFNLSRGFLPGGTKTLVNLTMNTKSTNVVNTPLTFLPGSNLDGGEPSANFQSTTVTIQSDNPVPTFTNVTPNTAIAGASATPITVTGTNFVSNSQIRVNGTGISTTFVSSTSLTGTIPVENLATASVLNITVFNPTPAGGTSGTLPFTVGNPAPVPTNMSTGSFFWGTTNATVTGTSIFSGATLAAGSGVSFSSYNYTSAPTAVSFVATVVPGTTLGIRPLTIQNVGSGTATVPGDVDIRYRAPSFTSVTPSSSVQGTTLNVVVTGTDFFDQTQVKTAIAFGAGITVNTVTINSINQLTANITVNGAATIGTRDITLTNAVSSNSGGTETATNAFEVVISGNPAPDATSITPVSGVQGTTVPVTITGTNFNTNYTSVTFGAGLSVSNLVVNSSTSMVATVVIAANATTGLRSVTVTNAGPGGGVDVLTNAFTVLPIPNVLPVANNDLYSTPFNTVLNIIAPGILANDTDDDGVGNLTSALVTNVTSGTLALTLNGGFTYTPAPGFSGNVQFTYRAIDGDFAQSNIATVTITVGGPVNAAPLANDDNYNTALNTSLVVAAPGFLGNDIDDGGIGNLVAQVITPAPGNVGTVVVGTNGSINYTPASNYSGTFEFTYRATDGQSAISNLGTVRITVTGSLNAPPTANNDSYAVAAGATLTVNAPGILANDTDDGGFANLTAELVQTENMSGSFTLNPNGSFTYAPITSFFGTSTFTYRARDAQSVASNVATVTITVGLAAPTHNSNWPTGVNPAVSTNPTLSFNAVVGAQFYDVQVSKAMNFGPDQQYDACYPDCGGIMKIASAESNTITYTTYNTSVVASGLKGATQYYWRARAAAMNGVLKGSWSEVRSFTTVAMPLAPILVGPNNNATGVLAAAELTWLASTGATNYNVQVSLNPTFDVNIVNANTGNVTFTTPALSGGPVFFWRVRATGIGGESVWSEVRRFTRAALVSIGNDDSGLPISYALDQNYPNPFNPSTTISFSLPESADVTLQVFNLHGQMVGTVLQNVSKNAGVHTISFDASSLSSGVYIYRIVAGNFTASQKMVLVK